MTDPISIRRANADDAGKLALLGQATFLTAFARDHPGDDLVAYVTDWHSAARYAGWAGDGDRALWIAETALGAPVGYAMLTPPELDLAVTPGEIELKRIYTLTGFQGVGLGRRLLEAVIAEGRARRAPKLYLCVYKANVAAQRFYARFGFERVGTQRFTVGKASFADFILAKPL